MIERHKNTLPTFLFVITILVSTVQGISSANAFGLDLHWLWHDRCAECHGHAGNFSRKTLGVVNGELQGRHHLHDLRRFLHNHYLSGQEVDAIYDMLLAQVITHSRFKDECSSCHGTAAEFVRNSLELHDGVLYGSDSEYQTRVFLESHRNLNPDDVEYFIDVLTRIAHEVYRP